MKKCKVEGCNCKHHAKGYCSKHYTQVRRYGKVLNRTKYDPNEIIEYEDYAEVILYNEECEEVGRTLIDLDDVERVKKYKWFFSGHGYVVNSEYVKLHRFITNCPKSMEVDHINHNKLDNRKSNLRICTHKQNCMNVSDNVKGIHYDKSRNKWMAYIKGKNLGRFDTKEEAIKVRKQAEIDYFGEYRNKEDEED